MYIYYIYIYTCMRIVFFSPSSFCFLFVFKNINKYHLR